MHKITLALLLTACAANMPSTSTVQPADVLGGPTPATHRTHHADCTQIDYFITEQQLWNSIERSDTPVYLYSSTLVPNDQWTQVWAHNELYYSPVIIYPNGNEAGGEIVGPGQTLAFSIAPTTELVVLQTFLQPDPGPGVEVNPTECTPLSQQRV